MSDDDLWDWDDDVAPATGVTGPSNPARASQTVPKSAFTPARDAEPYLLGVSTSKKRRTRPQRPQAVTVDDDGDSSEVEVVSEEGLTTSKAARREAWNWEVWDVAEESQAAEQQQEEEQQLREPAEHGCGREGSAGENRAGVANDDEGGEGEECGYSEEEIESEGEEKELEQQQEHTLAMDLHFRWQPGGGAAAQVLTVHQGKYNTLQASLDKAVAWLKQQQGSGCREEEVQFTFDSLRVSPKATPYCLGMGPADVIDMHIPEAPAAATAGDEGMDLKVECSAGQVVLRMQPDEPFSELQRKFEEHARQQGWLQGEVQGKLVFDGDVLQLDSTPSDCDCESGDKIEYVVRAA